MKKVLITGISGFVGAHLVRELQQNGDYEIYGTKKDNRDFKLDNITIFNMDITNTTEVNNIIKIIKPDIVYNLAAQISVDVAWKNPQETFLVNVIGTINLLEALRKYSPEARVLLIGSSNEYGDAFKENSKPSEDVKCLPTNLYAISKLTQNYIGTLYAKVYNMNIIMTRSFNHFGIGQSTKAVIANFCSQIALIEKGLQEPIIKVGNLDTYRDFLNVREIVKIYHILMLKGIPGEIYNVGSGVSIKVRDILEKLLNMSKVDITVVRDNNLIRPIDMDVSHANLEKIKKLCDIEINYDFDETLKETLDYYRINYSLKKSKEK